MGRPLFALRAATLGSMLALGAICAQGSAHAAAAGAEPWVDSALAAGYEAYSRRDAREARLQASLIPKDHLLRPWAQGWAELADPAAQGSDLVKFAKKFPPSLMRWRLLEEGASRHAKAGRSEQARAALEGVPASALSPAGRCALALDAAAAPSSSLAAALLAQGSGSELCSKAAARAREPSADALGSAFFAMGAPAARVAIADPDLGASPAAAAGYSAAARLAAAPAWDPAFPATSREALSREVATALGSGRCPADLPEPPRLTERGAANAARCALWTDGPAKALPYWRHLGAARPGDARWELLAAAASSSAPGFSGDPTSYPALAAKALYGAGAPTARKAPPASPGQPAARCQDMSATLALELWARGARREASAAWNETLNRSDPATRSCLGGRAQSAQAHALRVAAFAGRDFDPRAYEPAFKEEIAAAARERGIDPALFFSVARQESRFDERALSRSGAMGLFQLMPPTALETAARARMALDKASLQTTLAAPALNAALGAIHFSGLLSQFDKDVPWALCAYNAGAGRCKGWRSKIGRLPMVFRIEAIPYDETRVYVERILAGWSLTGEPDAGRAAFLKNGMPTPPAPRR